MADSDRSAVSVKLFSNSGTRVDNPRWWLEDMSEGT